MVDNKVIIVINAQKWSNSVNITPISVIIAPENVSKYDCN